MKDVAEKVSLIIDK